MRRRCNLTALGGAVKWQNEMRGYVAKGGCRGEEEDELAKSERSDGEQGKRARPYGRNSQVAIKAPCAANSQMKRPFSLHVTAAAAFAARTVSTPLSPISSSRLLPDALCGPRVATLAAETAEQSPSSAEADADAETSASVAVKLASKCDMTTSFA